MATIKSCTDISQSKKLAEVISPESADMWYRQVIGGYELVTFYSRAGTFIPAWSLAALLSVLPDGTDIVKDKADTENEKYMCTVGVKDDIISTFGNNPVDACYEMILKLKELETQ